MEIFDICDEYGRVTGGTVSRERAHAEGICHRTAHVWVIQRSGNQVQVLLQKRAMNKDSFPGCLDTSSAGHIHAGSEPLESALRELEEELGIRAEASDLQFVDTFRVQYEEEFHGRMFRDNEVAHVYVYEKPVAIGQLKLQEEEVEAVVWVDLEEAYQACRKDDPRYCIPMGGIETVRRYVQGIRGKYTLGEARRMIDEILAPYGPTVRITFRRTNAEIIDSYLVDSKAVRHQVCKILVDTGITKRTYENLAAEWELHNVSYNMHVGRVHAKDVSLDYDRDPHLPVYLATELFDKLNIE